MSASFIKVAEGANIEPIVRSLARHPELWDQNKERRIFDGSPHAQMTDIWVRFGDISAGFDRLRMPHDSVWYPCADIIDGAKEIAFNLMSLVNGERLGGVLITKLEPGKEILPHIDNGWHAEYYEKFYVALRAPKGSIFGFESGNIESADGDCFLFRNNRLHWVKNETNETRLTMVICIKTDMFKGV